MDSPKFAVGPGRGEIPKFSDVTPEAAKKFQDFQMLLNMNDRGWIETAYYLLGSDYRGSTSYLQSYMSHLGGWGVSITASILPATRRTISASAMLRL